MPSDLHNFVEVINYLFVARPAGCLKTGFTAFMLETLQRQRLVTVGGHPKTIGGVGRVTPAIVSRCLARTFSTYELSEPAKKNLDA